MKNLIIGFICGALAVAIVAYYPTESRRMAHNAVDSAASAAASGIAYGAKAADSAINAPPASPDKKK